MAPRSLINHRGASRFAIIVIMLLLTACRGGGWQGDGWARIRAVLAAHGRGSPGYDPGRPPVAAFDWDNTSIKNDIGYALFFSMLQRDLILQPPQRDWRRVSRYLSDAAVAALAGACGPLAEPGQPLPTSRAPGCAGELLRIYYDEVTRGGAPAYAGAWDHNIMEPGYALGTQLLGGHREAEVRAEARRLIAEQLSRPVGAQRRVAGRLVPDYIRVYEPMRRLYQALREAGFVIWVVSASPQPVVSEFARHLGIADDHVIGVRLRKDPAGRFTYDLVGCGGHADGDNAIIPYKDGKRCFLNQAAFGLRGPAALRAPAEPRLRPVLGAGDADSDRTFLSDSTTLRIMIDRGAKELLQRSQADPQKWIRQPMFIEPMVSSRP